MVERNNRNRPVPEVSRQPVADSGTQRAIDAIVTTITALVRFAQPFVQPESWKLLPYHAATWTDYPAVGSVVPHRPSYRKNAMGRVELRGVAQRSGGTEIIGVLPVGYRPAKGVLIHVYVSIGNSLLIVSDGQMLINGDPGGAAVLSLDGVTFDTEA